jgi:hypothetical protein
VRAVFNRLCAWQEVDVDDSFLYKKNMRVRNIVCSHLLGGLVLLAMNRTVRVRRAIPSKPRPR